MLTGGCSLLKGFDLLAQEVFDLPAHIGRSETMAGPVSAFENPQYSVAIGLVRYAQVAQSDQPSGWFSRMKRKIFKASR